MVGERDSFQGIRRVTQAGEGRAEVLFLALTRPSLTFGVPIEGLVLNGAGSFWFGAIMARHGSLWQSPLTYWLVCIPVHLIMRRLISLDWHAFRTLLLWVMTVASPRLEAIPTRRASSPEDLPSSV
jgi:type IV secretory pathway VirB3-like protein